MSHIEQTELPDFAWLNWKQAIIHKHRLKFWILFICINVIYPIILMSFCWNLVDCANIIEWKIYLIINPFIFILWFSFYAQIVNICCGPSPIRRYSKCSFMTQSILSNWSFTIGLWCLFSLYIIIKMIYFAASQPKSCNNTYQSFHLFIGFMFIIICNICLVIIVSKEQFNHFCSIYKSNSLTLPWNINNNNNDSNENDGYHEPQIIESIPLETTEQRETKYNFFGSAIFETYFKGISTPLNRELTEEKECSICMDEIQRNHQTVILICNHKFHEKCIVEWLKRDGGCPLCRTNCRKDDAPLSNI